MYKFENIMTKMDIYPLVKSLVYAREKDLGTTKWVESLDDDTIKKLSKFDLHNETKTEEKKILREQILLCAMFLILYEKNDVSYAIPEDQLIEGMEKIVLLAMIEGFVRTGLMISTKGKKCAKWYILNLSGNCKINPEVIIKEKCKEGTIALKPEYSEEISQKLYKFLADDIIIGE